MVRTNDGACRIMNYEDVGAKLYDKEKIVEIVREETLDYIPNNIFFRGVDTSTARECAEWIENNKGKVTSKIWRTFATQGEHNCPSEVEECYNEMLYYYIEFVHKAFDEDYFQRQEIIDRLNVVESIDDINELKQQIEELGREENEYKMEHYVLKSVYNGALSYVKKIKKSKQILRYDLDSYDEDSNTAGSGLITQDSATSNLSLKRVDLEIEPEAWVEYSDLQDIYDNELHIYDEEFQKMGLTGFSTRKYIDVLFLSGLVTDEEKADELGVPVAQLHNYMSGFKVIVQDEICEGGEYCDLMDSVSRLVIGYSNGWLPKGLE